MFGYNLLNSCERRKQLEFEKLLGKTSSVRLSDCFDVHMQYMKGV